VVMRFLNNASPRPKNDNRATASSAPTLVVGEYYTYADIKRFGGPWVIFLPV